MRLQQLIQSLINNGWSQAQIQAATGIAQPSISNILQGHQVEVRYSAGKRLEETVKMVERNNKRKKLLIL